MKHFVETDIFKRQIDSLLNPEEYRALQNVLIQTPRRGNVIRHTGGARKLRFALSKSNKGKRAGLRVIYYVANTKIYLLLAYSKGRQDNITKAQRDILRSLIANIED